MGGGHDDDRRRHGFGESRRAECGRAECGRGGWSWTSQPGSRNAPGSDLRRLCESQLLDANSGQGSIVPYGRIELDAIYSNRNTNPLDPGQFNGYATAAGKSSNASSTLNQLCSASEPTGLTGNTHSPVS